MTTMTTMTTETAILIDTQIVTWTAFAILAMFFVSGHFFLFLVNFFSVLVFGYHESWLHCNYFIVIVVLSEELEGTQAG